MEPEMNSPAGITNALSVDVEDYFQVAAFESVIARGDWNQYECRIPDNVSRLLDLFAKHEVHATFFTLGWVAERFPALVRRIADAGHEVASHGYDHARLHTFTPGQLRADVLRTKELL